MTIKKQRRYQMCLKKITYRTAESADEALAWMLNRRIYDQHEPQVYRCDYGNHYHVGHQAKRR